MVDVDGVGAARGDFFQRFEGVDETLANWFFGSIVLNGVRSRMKS